MSGKGTRQPAGPGHTSLPGAGRQGRRAFNTRTTCGRTRLRREPRAKAEPIQAGAGQTAVDRFPGPTDDGSTPEHPRRYQFAGPHGVRLAPGQPGYAECGAIRLEPAFRRKVFKGYERPCELLSGGPAVEAVPCPRSGENAMDSRLSAGNTNGWGKRHSQWVSAGLPAGTVPRLRARLSTGSPGCP